MSSKLSPRWRRLLPSSLTALVAGRGGALMQAVAVMLLGTAATALLLHLGEQSEQTDRQERFQGLVEKTTQRLVERLQSYEKGLRGVRAAMLATGVDQMTLDRFRMVMRSRDVDTEFPGARGLGFIRRVAPDEQGEYLHRVEKLGRENFRIRSLGPTPGDRFVIQFIEPQYRNEQAVGLDVASEVRRRETMVEAMRTGRATLTRPITLVQATGQIGQGFLLMLPVYPDHRVPSADIDRLRVAVGTTYAPLVIQEVLQGITLESDGLRLRIADASAGGDAVPFYESGEGATPGTSTQSALRQLAIYGRNWQISFETNDRFEGSGQGIRNSLALMAGLLASVLLAILWYREVTHLRALRTSQRQLQLFIDHAPVALAMFDKQMNILAASQVWLEPRGLGERFVLGQRGPGRPSDPERTWSAVVQRALQGESLSGQNELLRLPHGQQIWINWEVRPWYDTDHRIGGLVVFTVDITQEHQARQALEQSENRFRAVVEQSILGVFICQDQLFRYVNPFMLELFGYEQAEEMVGQVRFTEHLVPDQREAIQKQLDEDARQGTAHHSQFEMINRKGRTMTVEAFIRSTQLDGQPVQLGVLIDISDRLALEKARQDAELASEAKSRFLAVMSHEIRTPLNAIIGMCYLLERGTITPTQREQIGTITAAGNSLLSQINDLLDLSRIEAGEVLLESMIFDLPGLVRAIGRIYGPLARAKRLVLILPTHFEAFPPLVEGDRQKLLQMLTNLLSNALKFTLRGQIELTIDVVARVANRVALRFSVSDTGIGISADVLARLFKPFVQADASTTRTHGGTGLGLSLVSELARCMGGQTGVNSSLGQGSTFWFEVPLSVAQAVELRHRPLGDRPLQILAADDAPADREWLQKTAARLGWQATVVNNGQELLEKALAMIEQEQPLDCVLLDWRMPTLDGLAALDELHRRVDPTRMPAVIMITAADRHDLIRQLENVDARPHSILTKPVNPSSLFNTVNESVSAYRFNHDAVLKATQVSSQHSQWLPGVKVMVVDDSLINLDVCERLLAHEGALTTLCESGQMALETFENHHQEFDAVLMDIHMPGMDGFETTRQLRDRLAGRRLPIIALTAGALASERAMAFESGVDDFLTKPIDPQQLIRVIRTQVETARGCALPIRPRRDIEPVPDAQNDPWPHFDGFDLRGVKARLTDDLALFTDLLSRFEHEAPMLLTQAWQSCQTGDVSAAAFQLHRLRGQAGNLGATQVHQLVTQLENQARESGFVDGPALDRCSDLLAAFLQQMAAWRTERAALEAATMPGIASGMPLSAQSPETPLSGADDAARTRLLLSDLQRMLESQSMTAIERFTREADLLRPRLDPADFQAFSQALLSLDFQAALAILQRADLGDEAGRARG